MAVSDVIASLEHAAGPDRQLDVAIARAVGFERKVGLDGHAEWQHPAFRGKGLPSFTASMDTAFALLNVVAPKSVGGVSWVGDDACTAILNGGEYCHGATPALAMCVAALKQVSK